ncbi:DUF4344 domain-containing metallopeptidase [Vibrio sp. RC27]
MTPKKILLAVISYLCLTTIVFAKDMATTAYEKPSDRGETRIENKLRITGAAEEVTTFINQEIQLSRPLNFIFGGNEGPLYDSELNTVFIPYHFVQEVERRFSDDEYSKNGISVLDATMNAVIHTMFHEFGHALIYNYQLPIFGREEDAADSLASVLLIEYFEHGAEMTINAADLFDLESRDIDVYEEDFRSEHSLDIQRFYATLCQVYGSDPVKYSYLKLENGFSDRRAQICVEEYESLHRSWLKVLKPYLLNEQ